MADFVSLNGYMVKDAEARKKLDALSIILPSGDETGVTDLATIQAELNKGNAVKLTKGDYYIKNPITVRDGSVILGDGNNNTRVYCTNGFVTHNDGVSCALVMIKDIQAIGSGTGNGINIADANGGDENFLGGRYSYFENLRLSNFDTCVVLRGVWSANFMHCRFEPISYGVKQHGTCNHIKYDHCMFLGTTNSNTGLMINADNGAENYGIHVDSCDFERFDMAIYAYACVALNITEIYTEDCKKIIKADSCPALVCKGGYIKFPNVVFEGTHSSTNTLYADTGAVITDLFIKLDTTADEFLAVTSSFPCDMKNNTVVNSGGGRVISNEQYKTSRQSAHEYDDMVYVYSKELDARYPANTKNTFPEPYYKKPRCQYKLLEPKFILSEAVTTTSSGGFALFVNGVRSYNFTLPAGTYSAGHVLKGSCALSGDYSGLITDDLSTYEVQNMSLPGNLKGKLLLPLAHGEFIL